jgi:hypothetical protein
MKNSYKSIKSIIDVALPKKSEVELNEAQQNLLRLCRLMVDIRYRCKFENNIDNGAPNGYSKVTIK